MGWGSHFEGVLVFQACIRRATSRHKKNVDQDGEGATLPNGNAIPDGRGTPSIWKGCPYQAVMASQMERVPLSSGTLIPNGRCPTQYGTTIPVGMDSFQTGPTYHLARLNPFQSGPTCLFRTVSGRKTWFLKIWVGRMLAWLPSVYPRPCDGSPS